MKEASSTIFFITNTITANRFVHGRDLVLMNFRACNYHLTEAIFKKVALIVMRL